MMMMMIFWWCSLIVLMNRGNIAVAQRGCPSQEQILPCRCLLRGDEYQIWCSHSDLPTVLEGLRAIGQRLKEPIDELILENNYLPSLPGRTFIPLKIMRLMLRHNGLERVSNDWLVGLENSLMELFIVEPHLRSIPDDALLQMDALEAITIQTNLMKRMPLFYGLPKLRYLQIESFSLLDLTARHFKLLLSLEKLHVIGSPRFTRLEAVLLQDLPRLKLVNISHCGINWMHPRAITRLPVLKELSLVGNRIVDAGMIGRGSRDLPLLEIIRLDFNSVDKLGEAAFVDLPALKKIYLSNNRITHLNHGAFHQVPLLRSLDLNRNMVRRVHPESFLQHSGSGLQELWLIGNDLSHISELRSLLDALPRLTYLDISYNNLEAIPFGALRGHPTLEYLNLDYNKIHLIDREAFMAMPALRELRMKNNSLSNILEGPLWNLPALKGLDLSGNFFKRLEPGFLVNLPSLRKIDLSGNELISIEPSSFLMVPALEHINISYNMLTTLHPATFRHLLNLYELDASHNQLIEFVPGLPRGIEYLHLGYNEITAIPAAPSPDVDLPSLRMLDVTANRIQKILPKTMKLLPQLIRLYFGKNLLQQLEDTYFQGLSRTETLDLNDNGIIQIYPNAFKDMEELRDLNLQNNRLEFLVPDTFKPIPHLNQLNLSKNKVVELLPGTFDGNKKIQIIKLSHNSLVQFPPAFQNMKLLQKLDLTNNRIRNIDPTILTTLSALMDLKLSKNFILELKQGAFSNLQHLRILHLDNNEIKYMEPKAIHNLPLLKSIKLCHNKLTEIPSSAFNDLPVLQIVELQENQIKRIAPNSFNIVPHLLFLNLSHNQLTNIKDAGLHSLRSLEMLDVSNNRITRIAARNLEKMEWLVELRMDNNKICGIEGAPFNGMPRLRVLSMKNNNLMSFPEHAVHKLRGNIAVLDIDGNPLLCSCNLLWLQAWLQESSTFGPSCAEGGTLREIRISREDCSEDERNINLVAPGCEVELLPSTEMYGTSQVFSEWMDLNLNLSRQNLTTKNSLAPSPEESDYFYDEYVDYPYNETSILEPTNALQSSKQDKVKFQISTKSPHYTSGDTPTIYAASRNKTKPSDIPKEVSNSPSNSGFTFFGVPLPSINFNNLWGNSGRKDIKKLSSSVPVAERKTAIINKLPPRVIGRRGNLQPIDPPDIQMGGFIPVLPGSGGFKPIPNPIHQMQRFSNVEVNKAKPPDRNRTKPTHVPLLADASSRSPFSVLSAPIPQNTTNPVLSRKEAIIEHPVPTSESTYFKSMNPGTELQQKILVQSEIQKKHQLLSEVSIEQVELQEITIAPSIHLISSTDTPVIHPDLQGKETAVNTSDTFIIATEIATKNPETSSIPSTESVKIFSDASVISSSIIETTSSSNKNLEEFGVDKERPATPLSTLLIPGGQQSQYKPAGRPTITKVPSPHISGSAPLQSNLDIAQISEPLHHTREGKNTQIVITTEDNKFIEQNPDTNWYFANYNKTNIEPYIGGENIVLNKGTYLKIIDFSLAIIITFIIFVINGI